MRNDSCYLRELRDGLKKRPLWFLQLELGGAARDREEEGRSTLHCVENRYETTGSLVKTKGVLLPALSAK